MWQNSNPLKTNLKKESDLFFMQNIGNERRQEPKILKKKF